MACPPPRRPVTSASADQPSTASSRSYPAHCPERLSRYYGTKDLGTPSWGYSRSAGSSGSAGAAEGTARPRYPSGCIRRRTDLRPGSSDLLRRAVCTPLLCAPIWPHLWPRRNPRLVRFGRAFLGGRCPRRSTRTCPEPRSGAWRPLRLRLCHVQAEQSGNVVGVQDLVGGQVFSRQRRRRVDLCDQFALVHPTQPEQQFRLLVEPRADAVQHCRHMLAHERMVGAAAREADVARGGKQAAALPAEALHDAFGQPSL